MIGVQSLTGMDGSTQANLVPWWRYAVAAGSVLAVSALLTWCVRTLANRFGWVEQPRPNRWHSSPRAKLGGIAVFLALVAGTAVFVPGTVTLAGFFVVATGVFAFGLVDDFVGLRPQTLFVGQIIAALVLFLLGYRFGGYLPYWLALALVVLWVVGITNAMNLLDNMDGLAAGVAVIAGTFRLLLFLADGNVQEAMLTCVFVGAVGGFLIFNLSPASIFMGNCGALLIGFFLATINLTTAQTYAQNLISVLLFPVMVLAIPIFDTTLVSLIRWTSGRSISQGGRDHASHRLVALGVSEKRAVLILWAISIGAGVAAFALYRVGLSYVLFGGALLALGLVLFGIVLGSISLYSADKVPPHPEARASRVGFTLVTAFPYKRALLWIIVDVGTSLIAYYLAYLIRFGGTEQWGPQFQLFMQSAPVVIASLLVAMLARGLYLSEWKHFSLHEIRIIVSGATWGLVVAVLLVTYIFRFEGYSRAVFVLSWGATLIMMAGSRVFVRHVADSLRSGTIRGRRILIYGAGAAGELTLAEIRMNRALGQVAVGYIDDDSFKHRMTILGLPVLGGIEALPFIARKHRIEAVVVSSARIEPEKVKRLEEVAELLGLEIFQARMEVRPLDADQTRVAS